MIMLDWTLYNKDIRKDYKFSILDRLRYEKFFKNLDLGIEGICYMGGHDSELVIRVPDKGIGIKVYSNNDKKNRELINLYSGLRDRVYGDSEYIQKIYNCGYMDGIMYVIKEWVEGSTLKEMYNDRSYGLEEVDNIMDDFFLKIVIPYWSKGLVWKDGCLGNLVWSNKLVMIDTDNMYKTIHEILEGKVYDIRNIARVLNRDAHLCMFYDLISNVVDVEYYDIMELWKKCFKDVYQSEIGDGWRERSLLGYHSFRNSYRRLIKVK